MARITFVEAEITFKFSVITTSVDKISLFVVKITFVEAEITFKVSVITSSVDKISFFVAKDHLCKG